ncbi:creatininase family protein [Aeribacillus composti]|uniref:creatininase family protein n=1 Tax=Aeribacillus composti TaxID=1868734 RepID=UPI002E1D0CD9|nr:creatininase family protein [Aeribacillus composti]MED0745343.1 creatininase family protein [Aeribacillus composti]
MEFRYRGEAFEQKFFARLTSKEIAELPKQNALIILPVGAVEQHGPHLPVFTDSLIAEGILHSACKHLKEEDNIWILPPIAYSKSIEHLGYAGTISLSGSTLEAMIKDIAASLKKSGFRKFVLFNSHGGNHDLLNSVARDIRIETGLMTFRLNSYDFNVSEDLIEEKEAAYGIHGGEIETSFILSFKTDWVKKELCPDEFIQFPESAKHLQLKGSHYVAWRMEDISKSGILGNAKKASKETGEIIANRLGEKLAVVLREMAEFEMDDLINISTEKQYSPLT